MRARYRIDSRLSWVVAWLLAVTALAMPLLWPTALAWGVAMVLLVPIVGLTAWRADQKGYTADPRDGMPLWPPSS